MEQSIPALVQGAGDRFGDASAIEDGDIRLSFRQLAEGGLLAGRAFRAAGLQAGDRAAIWAPNYSEWILAAIGLQSAGGVLVPLNTRLKAGEAAYVLQNSGAKMLCTVSDFLGVDYAAEIRKQDVPALEKVITFRGHSDGADTWEDFLAGGTNVPAETIQAQIAAIGPDDLSDILFTSGTTGKPKGVMTAHGQNLRAFKAWSGCVGLREGDRYLIINPFFHAFGYKAGWVSAILRGATILPQITFDVEEVLRRIEPDRITMLPGPPTIYQTILAHPDLAKHDLSSLRLAVTGAAAIPVELIHQMRNDLGFETVITGYGLTETCGIVSMCREGDPAETIATTSGRPIDGVEVRLVDSTGKDVATGEPGEVLVRGYNVMRGYFANPEETEKTIDKDGFLHTGDIAVADKDFNLRITDRIKDMFIMGGFNCYPAEIENALYDSGYAAQVAVIGVPDERMGEVGMAFIVASPGKEVTAEIVRAWSRENMANYKVPRHIEIVDELPVNASGKVTKFILRKQAQKDSQHAGVKTMSRLKTENLLYAGSLWGLIEARTKATPEALFAVDDQDRELSFREYRDACLKAAAGFSARGVGEGTHVSWMLPTWFESMVLVGALARLGAVQNPILPIYRHKEVGFIATQFGTKLLILPPANPKFDYPQMGADLAADRPGMEVMVCDQVLPEGDPATLPPAPADTTPAEAPVRWVFYSSGTTSDPKGARHTDLTLDASARGMASCLHLDKSDRIALVFPFTHVGGIGWLGSVLASGAAFIVVPAFNAKTTPEVLARHGVTQATAGTAFHQAYLAAQRARAAAGDPSPLFPQVRAFPGGGAPKPPQLHTEIRDEMGGVGIVSGYGMTECPIMTMAAVNDSQEALAHTEGKASPPEVEFRLVTLAGKEAAVGEEGEIRVKAPQLCRGYLDESLNEKAFDEKGFFHTGDLGHLDAAGFLTITGRLKDVIIRKGENISAKEIEDLLYEHAAIEDIAVIGIPDPATGERACAVVQTATGQSAIGFEAMVAYLKGRGLMVQKIPEQLEVLEVIPRNATGKIDKKGLRETYKDSQRPKR